MKIISTIAAMQREADVLRNQGLRIACVPTMGFLHQGHLSLVETAKQHSDRVITTIFVNPTQFGPNEDFDRYPRDFDKDVELLTKAGSDILFSPTADEMYPPDSASSIDVTGITSLLEGATRPEHFKGVTTVVGKLLNISKPHVMVLGQKDAQQVAVIKRMVQNLNFDTEIIVSPTVRDADGLALSSRNTYLSDDERREALVLSRALGIAQQLYDSGVREADSLQQAVASEITDNSSMELDYAVVVNPVSLLAPTGPLNDTKVLVAVAARIGSVRLIDNIYLGSEAN
jgi:pantoate--beta-alanine ligase